MTYISCQQKQISFLDVKKDTHFKDTIDNRNHRCLHISNELTFF